jgi:tripartite-type tricarboxylate transporter receptor subunit TctC
VLEFHNTGKIRILCVNSPARLKAAPNIPTAIEQGVPNMVGQLVPRHLRAAKDARTGGREADRGKPKSPRQEAEFEKVLTDSGFETVSYSGDSALKYMADEHSRWKPVIDAIGLKTL